MIKTERELAITKKKIKDYEKNIKEREDQLEKLSITDPFVKGAFMGEQSFIMQMKEEVLEYQNIRKGKIPKSLYLFENIGLLLIALRIKNDLTQTELAEKLGVPQSQVSRDENNDYHGVSTTTIKKILKAYDEKLQVKICK